MGSNLKSALSSTALSLLIDFKNTVCIDSSQHQKNNYLNLPCRIQETNGVGSAEAIHSMTALSPATTVVFSGAATIATSRVTAGWEPKYTQKKKKRGTKETL